MEPDLGRTLPLWSVSAFVAMLLAIAILPLATPRWWHPNRNKFILALILSAPVIVFLWWVQPAALLHTGREFLSFVILLAALFVISGGIRVRADLQASPGVNTGFLALGAVLASLMGTTGAAMLLIRPLLDTNHERTRVVHTVVFFIFVVCNTGGLLTPIGDPPLFMGYLAGVPFVWSLRLAPEWALTNGILLGVYFLWDRAALKREPKLALAQDAAHIEPLRIDGWANAFPLVGVVLTVALLTEKVVPFPVRELVLLALALLSWHFTPARVRAANQFTFYPILEVAVLFFGIFATMIPAILILKARGGELGVTSPAQFFWASGTLSSFLDNTPTYVAFYSLAQSLGIPAGWQGVAQTGVAEEFLKAISVGSVFMGANTYIGNAPNFMVRSIAEARGLKMPSFFGYMLYSAGILIPIFFLLTWVFFSAQG